jgi:hypothetical protein
MPLYPPGSSQTSSSTPANPSIGSEWKELDSNNNTTLWRWNGTNWLSPQKQFDFVLDWNSSQFPDFWLDPKYNYLIESTGYLLTNYVALTATVNVTLTFFEFNVDTRTGTSMLTKLYDSMTNGTALKDSAVINKTIVPTTTNSIRFEYTKGGASKFTFRGSIYYRLIRK